MLLQTKAPETMSAEKKVNLTYYPSLNSPYTFVSAKRVKEFQDQYPINLITRPVLPMLMRMMVIPAFKGKYIISDAAREGRKYGYEMKEIFSPIGKPARKAYSLFPVIDSMGKGFEYIDELLKASFQEGINIGEDQIFNSQLLHFAESIPVCNKKHYIYDKTDASMMRSPWNANKFIEENYYIKFMGKAFINKPRLLETSLKARCQYLKTSMCKKLIQDLSILESHVIKYLWLNTLQSLDQSFSDIEIDTEIKNFNESLENRIPGCIDFDSPQDFKCLFQGTQIKCIKICLLK